MIVKESCQELVHLHLLILYRNEYVTNVLIRHDIDQVETQDMSMSVTEHYKLRQVDNNGNCIDQVNTIYSLHQQWVHG